METAEVTVRKTGRNIVTNPALKVLVLTVAALIFAGY